MGSPLAALLAASQGGGPDSISVNPADHPDQGQPGIDPASHPNEATDPVQALQAALTSLHVFVENADDEQDRQVALACYAKLQSILATEQKEKEAALGVTPQTKYMAKAQGRGGY